MDQSPPSPSTPPTPIASDVSSKTPDGSIPGASSPSTNRFVPDLESTGSAVSFAGTIGTIYSGAVALATGGNTQAFLMLFAPLLTAVLTWIFKSYGHRITGHARRDKEQRERAEAKALQQQMIEELRKRRTELTRSLSRETSSTTERAIAIQAEIYVCDDRILYLGGLIYQSDERRLLQRLGLPFDSDPKAT